jgi:tetratricopeptide (TPR) repeat protein
MAIYDAFISYSHAKDKPIASALQSVVQTLGKPWYKRRALRLFRDDTSLSATPHLWPTIEIALNNSRYLILIASAEAAHSTWVSKEVAHWLEHKSIDTLLIAVTEGELSWQAADNDFLWTDATPLPAILKGRFPSEPKWVDLRTYRQGTSKRDPRFAELGANFAAIVHGVPKEDLLSEEVRQQRRALTLAWSAVALLLVLGATAGWQWKIASHEKRIAEEQRDRAERTLDAATQTANGLVSDLAVRFREVKGIPLDVVQGMLGRGKKLLDDLIAFNEGSPAVQLIRAVSSSELGFTLAQQGQADGGKLATQGYDIAKRLTHDSPSLDGVDYALGRAAEIMGQLREREDRKAATDFYRESDTALGRCVDNKPKDLDCLAHQFMVIGRIGNVLYDTKQYNEALAAYQKSLGLAQRYAGMAPPGPQTGFDIGSRYNHLGRVYFQLRDLVTALQEFRQAQAAMEPWANDSRASSTFLFELSSTYNNIGNALALQASSDREKLGQAIAYTERAANGMEALAASDPANLFYWSNLAADYDNLVFLYGLAGNRGAQEGYARKRQFAAGKAKPGNDAGRLTQSPQ